MLQRLENLQVPCPFACSVEEKILFFERSRQRMLQDNVATEDVVDIQYSNLTWIPPLDLSPPGAFGGASPQKIAKLSCEQVNCHVVPVFLC